MKGSYRLKWHFSTQDIAAFATNSFQHQECKLHQPNPAWGWEKEEATAVTPMSMHTSIGSSMLPEKQSAELTPRATSPFLSPSPRRQGGGEALWLLPWPLLPGKQERGREGSGLPGQQQLSYPCCWRPEVRGTASSARGAVAAIPQRPPPSAVCRCLTESHPKVTKWLRPQ